MLLYYSYTQYHGCYRAVPIFVFEGFLDYGLTLLNLSSWCLVMVERLFLTVPRGCLQFVIVVFPDHTNLLFFSQIYDFLLEFYIYMYPFDIFIYI